MLLLVVSVMKMNILSIFLFFLQSSAKGGNMKIEIIGKYEKVEKIWN